MEWGTVITILGALGGWETIKYLLHLRTNRKLLNLRADNDQFKLMKETIEFLQQQLNEKERRFAEQTEAVRRLNNEIIASMNKDIDEAKEIGGLKLQLSHYKNWFCCRDYRDCKRREPEQKIKTEYIPLDPEL